MAFGGLVFGVLVACNPLQEAEQPRLVQRINSAVEGGSNRCLIHVGADARVYLRVNLAACLIAH